MNLIDRYLAAIAKHLPADRRQDIIAELSTDLRAQVEDRESELNRALTQDELAEMLRRHGHPLQVAMRYHPQRSLIGPAIFPYYLYVLKRSLPLVLFVYFITRGVYFIVDSSAHHVAAHLLTGLPYTLLLFWAITTLCFAVAEWAMTQRLVSLSPFETWDPLKLREPQTPQPVRVAPKYPIVDLICDALFTAWMIAIPSFPTVLFFGPAAHWFAIGAAPVWQRLYIPVVTLLVARLILKGIALDTRHSSVSNGVLYAAADGCSLAALALLVHSGEALFTMPGDIPARIHAGVEFGIMVGLRVALAFAATSLAWKLWQIARMRGNAGTASVALL